MLVSPDQKFVSFKYLKSINNTKNYLKLTKFQNEKLECALTAKEFSSAKEKSYKNTRSEFQPTKLLINQAMNV